VIEYALFAVLLVLGYGFGQLNEQRHYKSIKKREKELVALPAIATRHPPADPAYQQQMVIGSVVVASDYFKSFVANLVNVFGGRIRSYEPLLDRGRREALLRLKEEAKKLGATMVFNVKYETSRIGGGVTTIEVMAYGTALMPANNRSSGFSDASGRQAASV